MYVSERFIAKVASKAVTNVRAGMHGAPTSKAATIKARIKNALKKKKKAPTQTTSVVKKARREPEGLPFHGAPVGK